MKNRPKAFLKYSILSLILLTIYKVSGENNPNLSKNFKLYQILKRDLVSKEREYLKSNPLSSELRSFIDRLKRKIKISQKRDAEKQIDKEHMYVVRDGEIIPFKEIANSSKEIDLISTADVDEKFTVLPLIVPITVSKVNVKPKCTENSSTAEESTKQTTTEISTTITTTTPTTTRSTTHTTTTISTTNDEETTTPGPTVNSKLISRVFEDIKELMSEKEVPKENKSVVCKVIGDWDSTAGGMQIRIEAWNDTKYPDAHLVEREPPVDEGFFKEGNWSIYAFVPYFRPSSIIVLNAHTVKGIKLVATFIGECKVCEDLEAITGHWLIQRQSKDCSDREVSHKFISDVLKKNNVRKLQQEHLNSLASVPTVPFIG